MPDALRSAAAALLAVPAIASVYLSTLVRTRRAPLVLTVAIIAGTAGVVELGQPAVTGARGSRPIEKVPSERFRAVALPGTPEGAEFAPAPNRALNPMLNPTVNQTPETLDGSALPTAGPTPVPAPTPASPTVVRFRPIGGSVGVDRAANLSVRFSVAMDPVAASAFTASIDDAPIDGTVSWAEDATVLVLDPTTDLPYGARVVLEVAEGARSADGVPLASPRAVSFTVEPKPTPKPTPEPERTPRPTSMTPAPTAGPALEPRADWTWPLLGPITQRFGESRTRYGYHNGIDIDGSTGDPVRAARSGTVVVAGRYDQCGGIEVHIEQSDGLVSWYRHLSRVDVSVGDRVEAGELIGRVGNTGCSLGSHLHFAVRRDTRFLDPLDFLPAR